LPEILGIREGHVFHTDKIRESLDAYGQLYGARGYQQRRREAIFRGEQVRAALERIARLIEFLFSFLPDSANEIFR
jgi:hypothetical protein